MTELAIHVRDMMKAGQDPDPYIAARAKGALHEKAAATSESVAAKEDGAWTWTVPAERYLSEHVSVAKIRAGKVKPPKPKSIKDVRDTLLHPDVVGRIGHRLARDVDKSHIEALRDKWWREDRKRAQQKLCVYVAAAMKWAKAKHSAAHLAKIAPWWLELEYNEIVSADAMAQIEGRPLPAPLTAQQVAMVLHVAETNRVMPGRKSLSETTEVAMAALWWVALTAQRTHAAYQVIVSRIDDKTATDGWHVVAWLPGAMKGGRHFSLPISPSIYNLTLGRALADIHRRADSQWVFASSRTKVRGKDEQADKPIGDSILNSLLNRLRGKDALGDGVDLLKQAGLPHFTLHEIRDALVTHLVSHHGDLPEATTSAILDHASGTGDPALKEAAVTRDHYNKSHRLSLKFAGLEAWSTAVLFEYDAIRHAYDAPMRNPLTRASTARERTVSKRSSERSKARRLALQALASRGLEVPKPRVLLDLGQLGVVQGNEGLDEHGAWPAEEDNQR